MKIVIFGLSISSSWGNGHATLWRGLCRALSQLGHEIVFFERNQPYYAATRDWHAAPGIELVLYEDWGAIRACAIEHLRAAEVAIVTSYCVDAVSMTEEMLGRSSALPVFYDLDTPVTLSNVRAGQSVPYLGSRGLRDYELVLSFTGGAALDQLQSTLGARRVMPLYGHVDPDVHRPVPVRASYRADLSYLGTYASDRQAALDALFLAPARAHSHLRFLMAGAQYPDAFPWTSNVYFVRHLPPDEHAAFFSSSRITLNVTRHAMAELGWCPSGRLFEAAACRTVVLSDAWPGVSDFYAPGDEVLLARTTGDVLAALELSDAQLQRIATRAYERTLAQHTARHRALELIELLENASKHHSIARPIAPLRSLAVQSQRS